MGVVNDDAADRNANPVGGHSERGFAVYKLVNVDDEDCLGRSESRIPLVLHGGQAQRLGFGKNLLGQVFVGSDVNRGALLLIQAALEEEKADDRLSASGVHLD